MGLAGAAIGLSAIGTVTEGAAQIQSARFNRKMAYYDANLQDMQAVDALARGEEQTQRVQKEGAQVIGSQRASFAAQGIDVNEGSAAAVQRMTQEAVQADVNTVRNNARREAWGFRQQAAGTRQRGDLGLASGYSQAAGTFISGGARTLSYAGLAQSQAGSSVPRYSEF